MKRAILQHRLVAKVSRQQQQRFGETRVVLDRAADHDVLQHRRFADDARRLERAR
jgi:hypothetical protein